MSTRHAVSEHLFSLPRTKRLNWSAFALIPPHPDLCIARRGPSLPVAGEARVNLVQTPLAIVKTISRHRPKPSAWLAPRPNRWTRRTKSAVEITEPASTIRWRQLVPYSSSYLPSEENIHENIYSRSEEHTSELQSLMRISYAVFCL